VARIFPVRDDEAREAFERLQGVLRATLVHHYLLSEEEAAGAEEDLLVWFLRLARRGSGPQMPAKSMRLALLSATCQYGRSMQLWKLAGKRCADEKLSRTLSRDPEEMAVDLDAGLGKDLE
jgi:hypothetical protein